MTSFFARQGLALIATGLPLLAMAATSPGLERVMSDPDWIGNAPENAYWADDGSAIYYQQKREGEDIRDYYRLALDGSDPEQVDRAELPEDSGRAKVYSADRTHVAWVHHGDIMLKALGSGDVKAITRTVSDESQPLFSADDSELFFLAGGQFFAYGLDNGQLRQVTNIAPGKDPDAEPEFNVLREQQQRSYATVVEDSRRARAVKDEERRARGSLPHPVYLNDKYEVVQRSLSPNGQQLALVVRDAGADSGRAGIMPNYVTEDGYTSTRELRARVGANAYPELHLLVLNVTDGELSTIDTSELPGMSSDPFKTLRREALDWHVAKGADKDAVAKQLEDDDRFINDIRVMWSPDGNTLAAMLFAADYKDRWLATVDAEGELQLQHRLNDEAWINWAYNDFGWFQDSSTLWLMSEESGYAHLYTTTVDARRVRAITRGDFVVRNPVVAPDESYIYLEGNRGHPGNWQIFRVAASGGELERVADIDGVSTAALSPDGKQLLITRSSMDRHPDLYLGAADGSGTLKQLTDTVSQAFATVDWVVPEIVEVPSSHVEAPIYSKLYLPRDYDPAKRYPAVMFVHGAGYTQNAHMGWPYYFREFMFHTVLADAGYIVLDMDYRASEGYGRDWRTSIYRQMGHPELEDYLDGVDFLADGYSVDRDRIGIYGGSYGGFMTFMALFRTPEVFAAGAALRPVVDWMHYNHGYTARILNTPLVDPVAYEKSSPINHAAGLNKPLLIAAGMQDDNVFFQDSVLLVQKFIEMKKEDFEIAIYPLDAHGFVHPESWLDEYRRIFKLMENAVKNRRQ